MVCITCGCTKPSVCGCDTCISGCKDAITTIQKWWKNKLVWRNTMTDEWKKLPVCSYHYIKMFYMFNRNWCDECYRERCQYISDEYKE